MDRQRGAARQGGALEGLVNAHLVHGVTGLVQRAEER